MDIKEITVEFSYTKNMGNYESARAQAGLKVAVGPDDNPEELYEKAFKTAKDMVERELWDEIR